MNEIKRRNGSDDPAGEWGNLILKDGEIPSVPDHQLLNPIASGAYGEVWLARNAVGTPRAVKIVRRERHVSLESYEREFKGLQRFEPISRSHEGLVDILTLGLFPNQTGFYYVMELADNLGEPYRVSGAEDKYPKSVVQTSDAIPDSKSHHSPREANDPRQQGEPVGRNEGVSPVAYSPRTLRGDLKSRGALPVDEVIALGIKLSDALAHLHRQDLVHRDVKPSNILFIRAEPKLADAGLVTAIDDARSLVGTPGYIAPEGPGAPQADIYALGKVLYESAFGRDRQEFPALPADVASHSDHARLLELNEIIVRACARDPRERYRDASAMQEELRFLEAGKSIKRRRKWEQTIGYGKRLVPVGALIVLIFGLISSIPLGQRTNSSFKKSPVPEANEEYKRGITELHANLNAEQAIKHFEKATQLDPNFAVAYAQMADAWYSIPKPESSSNGWRAAEKAVSIDPQSGLAHIFHAGGSVFNGDFASAAKEKELALKLSPDSEEVLLASALISSSLGQTNEALANLKSALDLGRDTPSKLRVIYAGLVNLWCRQYDKVIAIYNGEAWIKDGVNGPHNAESLAYLRKSDYTNAIRLERQSRLEREGNTTQVKTDADGLEKAFKESGPEGYWKEKLKIESANLGDGHWMEMASIYAALKNHDKMFECLYRARKEDSVDFALDIYPDPNFDPYRLEPEFQLLLGELWKKK